ncbi:PREDICTED: uncharacterized protein LOC107355329 isoform X6 [Acropora digitifera]|uniref:uncharacterized protein LOC107355329 isoform X6 n=1 Tax=Acropora digitifera TaxID=70779 RepID=UPI00077AC0FF|nr:PREDICTED: uncharacterized protein LOC107355329 isoform X6 [Acropora digitifera]
MMSRDDVSEQADAVREILNITLLASEWKSSAGGLSTLNRELAIHLSQIQNVRVSLLVPEGACSDEDKREAGSFHISILEARKRVGVEPLLWLSNPPQDHKIDVIVGHGVKLGCQVQFIKEHTQFKNCKWVHVVHTAPEDLSKYKGYSNPISKGEKKLWDEVDLCKCADLVVPVGPTLKKAYHSYLQECKKDEDFYELIPGLFEREFGDLPAKQKPKDESDDFIVLLCGRGDEEDFELKGYNIAVKAFVDQRLKGKHYSLLFVGSPEGRQDKIRKRLLKYGITNEQLTVREFVKSRERMKELFCAVDMLIMPSKSEGFGLVALEALSAGLPILVGINSGFARAIEDVPFGSYCIVDSEDPAEWAKAIQRVRGKHGVILKETKMVKESYGNEYCWKKLCAELVDRLWKMVYGKSTAPTVAAADQVEQCPSAVPESVYQTDLKTMQLHIEEAAVTSARGKEGTSSDESSFPKLQGMNTNEGITIQRSEQQLSSVSSKPFYEPHYDQKSETNDEKKALAAYKNKQYVKKVGGNLIKCIFKAPQLEEEKHRTFFKLLAQDVQNYADLQDHSTDKLKGVGKLTVAMLTHYELQFEDYEMSSLIIIFKCQSLKSLELLWSDYLSGHLDEMAEQYLVTDEVKEKLNLETIRVKTTIEEENYLNCRKVLLECSGTSASQPIAPEDSMNEGPLAIPQAVSPPDQTTVQQQFKEQTSTSDTKNPKKLGKKRISETTAEHGTSAAQPIVPEDSVCPPDPTTVQQQFKERASTSGNKSPKRLGKRGISEPTDEQYGIDTSGIAKMLGSEQKLPSVSLETFYEPHYSMHESEVNEENKALATHGNSALGGFEGEADKTPSFAQQSVLDQGTSILGMASAAGNKEVPVKQEDTDWMTRKEKAGVNRENTDWLTRPEKARVKQEDTDWMTRLEKAGASRSALHKASVNGEYEEVKKYLSSGCAVDVKDQFLLTPLHLACWYGHESVVKLLLQHGADVNATDRFQFTPLHKAERRNYQSIVKLLLNHKARPTFQQPPSLKTLARRAFTRTDEHSGFNLLQAAVLEGDYDTVTKASVHLENFVEEMNCRTTGEKASIFPGKSAAGILLAVKWEMESYYLISKIYKELVETEKTLTRLHSCAKQNDLEMAIELVLNDGIDINVAVKRNISPLVWASPAASGLSIKTLIDLGADVNAQTFQESTFSFCSGTALRFAIHGNNAAVVKVLLANNADANIFDQQGNTVLHLSIFKRFFNISQLLIESGSEINVGNNKGETPLYCAVLDENVVGVKLLLKNNADTNIQDRSGNTPLHRSTLEGVSNISRLLIDSGCKINRTNRDGETPLYSAVRVKNVADVELLLQNDADANIQDTSGNTPLHISTFKGFSTISQLLIDSGCTEINRRSFIG